MSTQQILLIKQVEDDFDNIDIEYMLMWRNSTQMTENNIELFHDLIRIKSDQDNEGKYKRPVHVTVDFFRLILYRKTYLSLQIRNLYKLNLWPTHKTITLHTYRR